MAIDVSAFCGEFVPYTFSKITVLHSECLFYHRFLSLATYAEEHIEAEDAPVFLRFINLLINDAIYLLDEALGYMKQIQEQQLEQESWVNLPPQERSQNESQLMHIGRLARYHNIMGTGIFHLIILSYYFVSREGHSVSIDGFSTAELFLKPDFK